MYIIFRKRQCHKADLQKFASRINEPEATAAKEQLTERTLGRNGPKQEPILSTLTQDSEIINHYGIQAYDTVFMIAEAALGYKFTISRRDYTLKQWGNLGINQK